MNVQVNAKSAAKSVLDFVKQSGGSAKNTEALELVARICGFDSYRAMRAVSERGTALGKAAAQPAEQRPNSRSIETPGRVVFRSPMIDWEWDENQDADLEFIPERRRGQFEIVLEDYRPQFRVSIRPVGLDLDNYHGKPILDLLLEINDGVPCAHLTNDPAGEMLMSVFSSSAGIVARNEEGNLVRLEKASAPLYELAHRNGADHHGKFWVVENDTFARRTHVDMLVTAIAADAAKVPAAAPSGPVVQVGEEEAVAPLTTSQDPVLQNCVVHAKFDESVGEMQSWLDVSIVEPNGASELWDGVAGYTVFGKDPDDSAERQAFVDMLAPVAAYFVSHNQLKYMRELVGELFVRPNALELVRKCQEIVTRAQPYSVHLACDAVEALLAEPTTGLVLAGGSEDGVVCRHCSSYYSLDDEGIGLDMPCPSRKCPSHKH
jgi:hypothetical protein